MANAYNRIFSGAFLLVLMFSYGIIFAEERLLKSIERNQRYEHRDCNDNINSRRNILEHADYYEPTSVGKSSSASAQNVFRPPTAGHGPDVTKVSAKRDDFRPTTGGHGPGVGNIFEGAENDEPKPVGKSPGTVADVTAEKVFRPLIPGHSPSPDVPIVSVESNDFRPATLERRPGVGNKLKHAEAEKMFRPLIPGHGPSFSRVSGDSDDFRPTTPGHSPGAGHSIGPTSEGEN